MKFSMPLGEEMLIKRKIDDTEKTKAKKRAKEREKRRKKMIRTKYGQAPRRHAKKGIKSCIYAFFSMFFSFLMLAAAFEENGQIGILMGIAGFLILALAIEGVLNGIQGFKERDKNYITCKIGLGCNATILLCMLGIFIRGLI